MTTTSELVVLVGGHESAHGADLARLEPLLANLAIARPGRSLQRVARAGLDAGQRVVAVPMTLGRDPALVADTAKTLQWVGATQRGELALAAPFGVVDHLTAHLRSAAARVHAADPEAALLVVAVAANPFDDAELHRVAHLVRVHGPGIEVGVATIGSIGELGAAAARLRRLGFDRAVAVPAGFASSVDVGLIEPPASGVADYGQLMSDAAIVRIVNERVAAARHDLAHGHDGIAPALHADHDHGYAHSHADHDHHDHDHHHHDHHQHSALGSSHGQ